MTKIAEFGQGSWALILGASSGFGAATAIQLASQGMNIIGVHLDRKSTLPNVEQVKSQIESYGSLAVFFNSNAADLEEIDRIISEIAPAVAPDPGGISVLLHSLAFGALKPFVGPDVLRPEQVDMTLNVMANSLVYWVQKLVAKDLFLPSGRILGMTSSGSARAMPNYGAVSAAKCALESHCRQLSLELASLGITSNAIRAGVTVTPALLKIPGNERLIHLAQDRNPRGRLTTPEDVARVISLICDRRADWMTGNVINVDGGEEVVG